MPNWCYTNINIKCNSEKEAKALHDKIEKWTSVNYCENGFGFNWLGNIVGNSGIDDRKDGNDFSVCCRGSLIYLDITDIGDELIIDMETAWIPMLQMWKRICDKHLPSGYDIKYSAEETGCELYETNIQELIDEEPKFTYVAIEEQD